MLTFERLVKAADSDHGIYVFVDEEKGHTVYYVPSGSVSVIEAEKSSKGKDRVAGFLADNNCANCSGC